MTKIRLTIHGEPASKANSRQLVSLRQGRRCVLCGQYRHVPRIIKSRKALDYLDVLHQQVGVRNSFLEGNVAFEAVIYYASRRPDLDESLILDGLQGRVFKNDRQVREKHVFGDVDSKDPRAEIAIWPRN